MSQPKAHTADDAGSPMPTR